MIEVFVQEIVWYSGFIAALGAAIGAAGLGASIFGGVSSAQGQRDANKANLQIARENREFQERMSNTAVERRMNDLANSGINPLLAGRYDASTPPGNIATMGNTALAGVEGATKSAATVMQAMQMRLMLAQSNKTDAETRLLGQNLENEGLRAIGLDTANGRAVIEKALAALKFNQARTMSEMFKLSGDGLNALTAAARGAGQLAGESKAKLLELLDWLRAQKGRLPSSADIDRAAGWKKGSRFGGKR